MFVTLFNLQGTRCVPQRFLMISLRFPFVKNFFQKFFNFFSSSLIRQVLKFYHRRPHKRLNQDTILSSSCQELFQVFQTFFKFFRPLTWQEKTVSLDWPFMLALPIFPARLQASIFGRSELNFRVRNGNGWTLALINTNFNFLYSKFKHKCLNFEWWPVRESNPCLRRERPPS